MVSDPIADFIIRLKNASAVRHATCEVPFSELKLAIAEKLREAGYIGRVERRGKKVKKTLEVELLYGTDGTPKIHGVSRVSKPGRRLYQKVAELTPVKYGHGHLVLSTPAGIRLDTEAKTERVGGEALFKIW